MPLSHLLSLYRSWFVLLQNDHGVSYGYSVMGWLHSWFGLDLSKSVVVAAGGAVMLLPFLRRGASLDGAYPSLALGALMIWMVIFNHKAEGPTFIIAVAGITVWYGSAERSLGDRLLLAAAFVLVSLSPTEIFPRVVRLHLVPAYALKAVPCIAIWARCVGELLTRPLPARSPRAA